MIISNISYLSKEILDRRNRWTDEDLTEKIIKSREFKKKILHWSTTMLSFLFIRSPLLNFMSLVRWQKLSLNRTEWVSFVSERKSAGEENWSRTSIAEIIQLEKVKNLSFLSCYKWGIESCFFSLYEFTFPIWNQQKKQRKIAFLLASFAIGWTSIKSLELAPKVTRKNRRYELRIAWYFRAREWVDCSCLAWLCVCK